MSTTDHFSYYDLPTAAPTSIPELIPGARNAMEYCDVQPGEQVLILTENGVDPVVVQALAAAAAHRDALVHALSVAPFSAGGWDDGNSTALIAAIHDAADVIISCTWWGEVHTDALFFDQIARRKARFLSLHQTATASALTTGARFPLDLYLLIEQRATAALDAGSEITVTSPTGTHLTFRDYTTAGPSTRLSAGMWRPFPYGGVNFSPTRTDGMFVVEESTTTGTPAERTVVHLENNLVTSIDGGLGADELRRFGPDGYYLRHALIGLNPKVRSAGGTQFEREKHAGNFYLGLDGLDDQGETVRILPGHAHCDCQFDDVTIAVDDTVLVDRGRLLLLDDPDVRDAATRWGPAEHLLDPNPRLPLPMRYLTARS
ncbi:hypothetical protein [Rhodococcus sp. MEB064]|uniref:hypothetical protein n=1 Tax=Rhodococcus sp. MEB064 TaxID=1587522 RepID=UPI0005ACE35D|nr:hypothetical protein [Rhodococcus sp. MEB064]KIQ17468.1 hypothetical protein RU01_09760 [Rhodococcus sp. MEB064]